jgi:hypothetical protein
MPKPVQEVSMEDEE